MKAKFFSLLFVPFLIGCSSLNTSRIYPGGDSINPFDYQGNVEIPELNIDGKDDDPAWTSEYATEFTNLTYKSKEDGQVRNWKFKLYRGIRELYAYFYVEDYNILSDGNDNGTSVTYSDSCEVYLDTLNDGGLKPQTDDYQINLGCHSKTRIMVGNGAGWGNWNGLVQYETVIDGTLNDPSDIDNYYSVEMCIPYKSIGIKRDTTIGVTFGVVDKFHEGSGQLYKFWTGTTIGGHYGNPQVPDEYFLLEGIQIKAKPEIKEYIPSEDTTSYITGFDAYVPEDASISSSQIDLQFARNNNLVTILATLTSGEWNELQGLCVSFDLGVHSRGTRDYKTYILRFFPGLRTIKDFFTKDAKSTGVSRRCLDVRCDSTHAKVVLDMSQLAITPETDFVSICVANVDIPLAVKKIMVGAGLPAANDNIVTWPQLSSDNHISKGSKAGEYVPSEDTTSYITGFDAYIDTDAVTLTDRINVEFSRVESIITVRMTLTTGVWSDNHMFMVSMDFGNGSRTTRDENTLIARFSSTTGTIKDFFGYPNVGKNKNLVNVKVSDTQVYFRFDTSSLPIISEEEYIRINVTNLDSSVIVHNFMQAESLTCRSDNMANWPKLYPNNTIVKGGN